MTHKSQFQGVIKAIVILVVIVAVTISGYFLFVIHMLNHNPNGNTQIAIFSPLSFLLCLALFASALILYRGIVARSSDKTKRHDQT